VAWYTNGDGTPKAVEICSSAMGGFVLSFLTLTPTNIEINFVVSCNTTEFRVG